jgi:hypothetical protein
MERLAPCSFTRRDAARTRSRDGRATSPVRRRAAIIPRRAVLWVFRAESAQEIDDQAYRQNQTKPSAADDGAAKVKPAAAEQEE